MHRELGDFPVKITSPHHFKVTLLALGQLYDLYLASAALLKSISHEFSSHQFALCLALVMIYLSPIVNYVYIYI